MIRSIFISLFFVSIAQAAPQPSSASIKNIQKMGLLGSLNEPYIRQAMTKALSSGDEIAKISVLAKGTQTRSSLLSKGSTSR